MEHLIVYKSPFMKKRVGKSNDGGYVITKLPCNYDLFISSGHYNGGFETSLLTEFPHLHCYFFDGFGLDDGLTKDRFHFIQKHMHEGVFESVFIENAQWQQSPNVVVNEEVVASEGILSDSDKGGSGSDLVGLNCFSNVFMKLDIRGYEFKLLPLLFDNGVIGNIKQLVINFHSPFDIQKHPDYYAGLTDFKNKDMFSIFERLNHTHVLVHFHANNVCGMGMVDGIQLPYVFELTYIHREFVDCGSARGVVKNESSLPTVFDNQTSVNMPDYHLSGFPYSVIDSHC